jgi:ketosteroid isomerase-like protein
MLIPILIATSLSALPVQAAQEPDHEIHEELRAILKTVQGAITSGNYDAMLPVVSKDIRATPINQEVLSSHEDVSAYFKRWFGPGGFLKKLDMNFEADARTELSPDKTWGLVRGSGDENYTLADGRTYDLKTRWTATIAKESDGKWRLRAIHIGTNFLDNPILTEAKSAVSKYSMLSGLGGLVVGAALSFFLVRPKK